MLVFCSKCELKLISTTSTFYPLCYICGLKEKRFYKSAIKALKDGIMLNGCSWWGYGKKINFNEGWSFVENMLFTALFISVLKSRNLNKTAKTNCSVSDFFSEWQIKTAKKRYNCNFD